MNNLEKIISHIEADGINEAQAIIKAANEQAQEIVNAAMEEGKKLAELVLYNRFGNEEYFTALCNAYIRFILLSLEYPKSDMNAIVYKMTDYMKKNYDNSELSITKLLRESGYAKDYVRTKFFEVVKMTPKKYLTTVRMKKAKELINLYGEDVSIARIAELCGIVDPAVFSKNFKKFYGISPKQYMQTRKKG